MKLKQIERALRAYVPTRPSDVLDWTLDDLTDLAGEVEAYHDSHGDQWKASEKGITYSCIADELYRRVNAWECALSELEDALDGLYDLVEEAKDFAQLRQNIVPFSQSAA